MAHATSTRTSPDDASTNTGLRPHTGWSENWQVAVPTAVVLLVLAILVVLPFARAAYLQPFNDHLRNVAEPARAEVTRIHVALALEGTLLEDYIQTRDPTLATRYREAVRLAEGATARLALLADDLGDTVRARFAEMRRLQSAWHQLSQQGLTTPDADRDSVAGISQGAEYEALLLAAARVDEAIGAEVQRSYDRITAVERAQRWLSAALALLGFAGAGAVAWLARRLRDYAVELDRQRTELVRATESRARLIRGVSHDLKNPLHALDGHAQLLEEEILGPLQPRQRDSVARIRGSVRTMLTLVNDLVELSQAEAGHLTVRPRPVHLATMLGATVNEHRGTVETARHQLDLVIAPGAPETIVTDEDRVRQVLGNLLSNAVKYTPNGGRIALRADRATRDGDPRSASWLGIEVADSGPGIPDDQRETIFDEFFRLPIHSQQSGSGLGLAIARRVARLLGGDLTVEAGRTGGAVFTLWLPLEPRG